MALTSSPRIMRRRSKCWIENNYKLAMNDNSMQPKSPTYQGLYSTPTETKICIMIDSKAPQQLRVPVEPGNVTLAQFKSLTGLGEGRYKFYFKSHDSEFGMVKEELVEDDAILPADNGNIVAWVISDDSVQYSLFNSSAQESTPGKTRLDAFNPYQSEYGYSVKSLDLSPYGKSLYDRTEQFVSITANLFLETNSTLGLTVLCPSDELCYAGGILVDKIQPNSVAWHDGRIQAGDRIVEINGFDLRKLAVSEAITIFREFIDRKGAINITLERKNHDLLNDLRPSQKIQSGQFESRSFGFDPATELPAPVIEPDLLPTVRRNLPKITNYRSTHSLPRSISPRSWYTTSNFDNLTTTSDLHHPIDSRSVYESTTPTSLRKINVALHCGKDNIYTIYEALKNDAASLEIRDRDWLKVVVKDAFIGSTLIKWLSRNVYGFCNRSEIKRFANQMLSLDLIKSPVSNSSFSEKCYYTLS